MIQSPGLQFPTSGVQVQPLTIAPRLDRPDSREDKTLRLMVKAALISQEHLKMCTLTKRKEERKKRQKKIKRRVKKEESNHDCKK